MKYNILNKMYWIAALGILLLASCINDSESSDTCPKSYNIRVSVRSGSEQSRASDVIAEERIKRYDIFIYEPGVGGSLIKYIGKSGIADEETVSVDFKSNADFTTGKDIYAIVNNADWEGKDEAYMKGITKAELLAYELACQQNVTEAGGQVTDFVGYRKSATENEPFVMSALRTSYNFSADASHATLSMELKRTYAKVILKFKTGLTQANDADWIDLKTIRIRAINNIPNVAKLFCESGADCLSAGKSYVYKEGDEYVLPAINADLTQGAYTFDTFASDRLALRLFPYNPSGGVDTPTSMLIDFEVGSVGDAKITQTFKRLIQIGDVNNGYQVDPNYAYIITITYGKTTNSITATCKVVPWNLISVEEEVEPD